MIPQSSPRKYQTKHSQPSLQSHENIEAPKNYFSVSQDNFHPVKGNYSCCWNILSVPSIETSDQTNHPCQHKCCKVPCQVDFPKISVFNKTEYERSRAGVQTHRQAQLKNTSNYNCSIHMTQDEKDSGWVQSQSQYLQIKINTKDQMIATLKKQVEELCTQLEGQKAKYKKLKKELQAQLQVRHTKSGFQKLEDPFITPGLSQQKLHQLQKQSAKFVKTEIQCLRQQLWLLKESYSQSEARRIESERLNMQLEKQLEYFKSTITRLNSLENTQLDSVEELFNRNQALEIANAQLKRETQRTKQKLEYECLTKKQSQRMKKQATSLKAQLEKLNREVQQLSQQNIRKTTEIQTLQNSLNNLKHEHNLQKSALITQLEHYQKQHQSSPTCNSSRIGLTLGTSQGAHSKNSNSLLSKLVSCESEEGSLTASQHGRNRAGSIRTNRRDHRHRSHLADQESVDISQLLSRFDKVRSRY